MPDTPAPKPSLEAILHEVIADLEGRGLHVQAEPLRRWLTDPQAVSLGAVIAALLRQQALPPQLHITLNNIQTGNIEAAALSMGSGSLTARDIAGRDIQHGAGTGQATSAVPGRDLIPGGIIDGKYRLVRVLGQGGNGAVWLADELLPDHIPDPVALKILHPDIQRDAERVQRFTHELSRVIRLSRPRPHPNIVAAFSFGWHLQQLYVVMQYVDGGTLRKHMAERAFPLDEALLWLDQLAEALDYAHARGIVHRDVKPENMLLTADQQLYLADFGLAFSPDDRQALTGSESRPVGTGRYMAPEQWQRQRDRIGPATDRYALGILAYELLTGQRPFVASDDDALSLLHCEADLPADPHLPQEVLRILSRATAKQPEERYPSARAFVHDLRHWQTDPANLDPRIADYLDLLQQDLFYDLYLSQFVELGGDRRSLRPDPLPPQRHKRREHALDFFERLQAAQQGEHVTAEHEDRTFVENVRTQLLYVERGVLVGEPGSGKTWMLRRLTLDYAAIWRGEQPDPVGHAAPLIPVLVELNAFRGEHEGHSQSFADFAREALGVLAPYHDQLLREGRLVLLCDALNEMPRSGPEGRDLLAELCAYLAAVPNFIVSCRVRDYRDDLGSLKPLEQVILHDLELPAIRDLVQKRLPGDAGQALWADLGGSAALEQFWLFVQEKGLRERFWIKEAERELDPWRLDRESSGEYWQGYDDWQAMHGSQARLMLLCRNPFLAHQVCTIYLDSEGALPQNRAALFKTFVDFLLAHETENADYRGDVFPPPDTIKTALVALAKAMQAEKVTTLSQDKALQAVTGEDASALLQAAADANLLAEEGGSLRFAHQLIQEYFAAQTMLEALEAWEHGQPGLRPADFFDDPWWDAGVWRETTVILGEFLGEGAVGPNRVARWLAAHSPEVALEVILRNAAGLTPDDVEDDTREALLNATRARIWRNEPDPSGRAAAYRVLGYFNADNREGVGLNADGLPDIDWVTVPAGEFWMGSDPETDPQADTDDWNEAPQHWIYVDAFDIARYPVTYAQYEAFVNDKSEHPEGAYAVDRYWTAAGLKWREKKRQPEAYWQDPQWHIANHPVVGVTWYEAMAFCRWLSEKTGQDIQLPSETQWEKAARGDDGRIYPYGNEFDPNKGNTSETGIGQTTAVGLFPDPALPYGLLDMSGNVWEWCASKWRGSYEAGAEDNDPGGEASRAFRGGSWYDSQDLARAAARFYGYDSEDGLDYYGFRCLNGSVRL